MGIVSERIRKQVFRKCDGKCCYCGNPLEFRAMQVDHLTPCYWDKTDEDLLAEGLVRGADHYDNLMPSCRRCNKWKDKFSVDVFRQEILKQPARLLLKDNGYKLALDYGLIITTEWDGKFYFERMQNYSQTHKRVT